MIRMPKKSVKITVLPQKSPLAKANPAMLEVITPPKVETKAT